MGERRWRASSLANIEEIPAIVKTTPDDQMLRDALLENLHRVALNPLEEAAAYQQMIQEFGLTQEQLSQSISKSRPQIANMLRLLQLPGVVQKKVASGVISAGHARALLALSTQEEMESLANRIIAEGLSVRSTEEIVSMTIHRSETQKTARQNRSNIWADSEVRNSLEDRFETKVSIKGSQKKGRIEIVFSSPEDMQRIVDMLLPAAQNNSDKQDGWV
jgi:ParB family chromosome partitioning protein